MRISQRTAVRASDESTFCAQMELAIYTRNFELFTEKTNRNDLNTTGKLIERRSRKCIKTWESDDVDHVYLHLKITAIFHYFPNNYKNNW